MFHLYLPTVWQPMATPKRWNVNSPLNPLASFNTASIWWFEPPLIREHWNNLGAITTSSRSLLLIWCVSPWKWPQLGVTFDRFLWYPPVIKRKPSVSRLYCLVFIGFSNGLWYSPPPMFFIPYMVSIIPYKHGHKRGRNPNQHQPTMFFFQLHPIHSYPHILMIQSSFIHILMIQSSFIHILMIQSSFIHILMIQSSFIHILMMKTFLNDHNPPPSGLDRRHDRPGAQQPSPRRQVASARIIMM